MILFQVPLLSPYFWSNEVDFQCPIVPELCMLCYDMICFSKLFKDVNNDEETLEAYKYAFKDYTAWNRPLNYYRMTTTKKFTDFLKNNKDRFKIGVRLSTN